MAGDWIPIVAPKKELPRCHWTWQYHSREHLETVCILGIIKIGLIFAELWKYCPGWFKHCMREWLTGFQIKESGVFHYVLLLPTYPRSLRRNQYKMFGLGSKKTWIFFMSEALTENQTLCLGLQSRTSGNLVNQSSLLYHCTRWMCYILWFPKHHQLWFFPKIGQDMAKHKKVVWGAGTDMSCCLDSC
jgi:hypothetical protein